MSRHGVWRCHCSREVGTIRWHNGRSVLKLARSVEDVMLAPGCSTAICPACGLPVYFESREQGWATTMMTVMAG